MYEFLHFSTTLKSRRGDNWQTSLDEVATVRGAVMVVGGMSPRMETHVRSTHSSFWLMH